MKKESHKYCLALISYIFTCRYEQNQCSYSNRLPRMSYCNMFDKLSMEGNVFRCNYFTVGL